MRGTSPVLQAIIWSFCLIVALAGIFVPIAIYLHCDWSLIASGVGPLMFYSCLGLAVAILFFMFVEP